MVLHKLMKNSRKLEHKVNVAPETWYVCLSVYTGNFCDEIINLKSIWVIFTPTINF